MVHDDEIHFRVDSQTKKKFKELADGENRTVSNYLLMKLKELLKNGL